MRKYIAVMRKAPDSDFGVDFPDFPGCISGGKTMEEAFVMAHEALEGHIEAMRERGYAIPKPRIFDQIKNDPEIFETGDVVLMFLVTLPEQRPKAVRINITIPENVIAEMDDYVRKTGETRSGLLTQAVREYLRKLGSKIKPSVKLKKAKPARKKKAVA